ncbi:hypothetical protein IAU59_006833 [Kwoniella sp. CBS 9459]
MKATWKNKAEDNAMALLEEERAKRAARGGGSSEEDDESIVTTSLSVAVLLDQIISVSKEIAETSRAKDTQPWIPKEQRPPKPLTQKALAERVRVEKFVTMIKTISKGGYDDIPIQKIAQVMKVIAQIRGKQVVRGQRLVTLIGKMLKVEKDLLEQQQRLRAIVDFLLPEVVVGLGLKELGIAGHPNMPEQ